MEKDTEQLVAEEAERGMTSDLLPAHTGIEDIEPYEDATEVDG